MNIHKAYLTLIGGLMIGIVVLLHLWNVQQQKIARQESIIAEKNDSLTYRKTREGKIIADKIAAEATAKEFKEAYPKLAETLTRDFDVKISNLKAFFRSEFQAHGTGNTTINNRYVVDSTGRQVSVQDFKINDGYLSLQATIFDSLHAPYDYLYSDSVQVAFHTKKKWLFGKEQLYGSGMMSNPNAKITGQTSILMRDYRDKRFNVSLGVLYDPLSNEWHPGLSVGWSLLKF